MSLRLVVAVLVGSVAQTARAGESICPSAKSLPQLAIDKVNDPAVPIVDPWQILWDDVPLSDAQLALLARDDSAIDLTRAEMSSRGTWVYIGMLTAAVGTALSCVGWVLFGQNQQLPEAFTLGMGLGGVAMGAGGVLLVTDSIQTPLEPHLAPTPRHRLSRAEARRLVTVVNTRLFDSICKAADATEVDGLEPPMPVDRAPRKPPEPQMP